MKLLLSAVLLFITVTVFGANPSYKDFRGTGGITIVSNPPQGTIVIDGSGISGGVSAATATNISQYFSTNTTGRPAPPISSVQFNSNGVVQGSAGFVYTNGNVGIGTSNPTVALEVIGNLLIGTDGAGGVLEGAAIFTQNDLQIKPFDDYNATNFGISFDGNGSSGSYSMNFYWYGFSADPTRGFSFIDGNTLATRMTIQSYSGNVGIGTTTPANRLDVEGAVAIGAAYSGTSTAPANGAIFEGNVGIGTPAPSTSLDVVGQVRMVSAQVTNFVTFYPTTGAAARMGVGFLSGADATTSGTNFGFYNKLTDAFSFYSYDPSSNNWRMAGVLTASNFVATTPSGSGDHVAIRADGRLMRTNITGLPAGANFEVQFNNAGVMGASPNLRFLGGGYQLQIVNPTASGEVDINGEGFISQATGGSAALAFGIGAQTNLMINPGGAVIVRPSPGIGTNSFQVEGTNKVPIVSVSSNGNVLVKIGLAVGPSPATITNTLFGSAAIDFPSVAAGSMFDSPITVTGCTSNNCHVSLCVPWEAASGGGVFSHYESNDVVYIRFSNNQLTLAIDPTPATFSALVFRVQ